MPRRDPKADWRRALELIAASSDGCTEAVMLAHGITVEVLADLVHMLRATLIGMMIAATPRSLGLASAA
jgi:predicted alpha/beta hydrolase family esterase